MSTRPTKKAAQPLAVETVSRRPQQGRSKASLERMLEAAKGLMLELGSEDFTLLEVSKRGNVSIGSIYLRFESKDNLVRAVIAKALEEISAEEDRMLEEVLRKSRRLDSFVPRYVEAYAEVLRTHAPLLRLSMQRAAFDPSVSGPGKEQAMKAESRATAAMLKYSDEFGGRRHSTKASSAYHVIFAALARELSLGSTAESVQDYDWGTMKRELGRMCLAYFKAEI